MTPYYADDHVTLYHGDCLDVLASLPDDSVDSVVTDPPYGLEFMGKKWDAPWKSAGDVVDEASSVGGFQDGAGGNPYSRSRIRYGIGADFQAWCDQWAPELLRVLKPGGHLLAFGAPRTYHRMAVAIEDAGFEVRDSLMWCFGSGFPKSHDIGKAIDKAAGAEREVVGATVYADGNGHAPSAIAYAEDRPEPGSGAARLITAPATPEAAAWDGWGTALKPAHEPIVLARKPLQGAVAANVLAWGVGGINVDGCRVGLHPGEDAPTGSCAASAASIYSQVSTSNGNGGNVTPPKGRWPANVILDAEAGALLDQQSGESVSGKPSPTAGYGAHRDTGGNEVLGAGLSSSTPNRPPLGDSGGASRFFYTPKADRHERPRVNGVSHPTVKPVDLMAYLVRLITPRGGTVLDPFAGTGTTAEAATAEGCRTILIERESDYLPLIMQRLNRPVEVTLL